MSLPTFALPPPPWNVSDAQIRTSVNDVNHYSRTEDFMAVVHMARGVLKAQANSKRAKSKPEAVDDGEPVVPAEARSMDFFRLEGCCQRRRVHGLPCSDCI